MRVCMFALEIDAEKKGEKCGEGFYVFFLFFIDPSFLFFRKKNWYDRRGRTQAKRRSSFEKILLSLLWCSAEKSNDWLQAIFTFHQLTKRNKTSLLFIYSLEKKKNALVSQLVILSLSVAVGKPFSHNRERERAKGGSERAREREEYTHRRKRWNIVERKRVSERRRKKRNDMN